MSYIEVQSDKEILLGVQAYPSNCEEEIGISLSWLRFQFAWTQLDSHDSVLKNPYNRRDLYIPANKLKYGLEYTFLVNATLESYFNVVKEICFFSSIFIFM